MFRILIPVFLALAACSSTLPAPDATMSLRQGEPELYPGETLEVRALVNKWADHYEVPRSLVHRVIQRESDYRPGARNGPYFGMMQILPATARNMGMSGEPSQLLEADRALKYSVRYLRGAWMVSGGDEYDAMMWYAKGYYYEAKRLGLLLETGLRGRLWQRYDQGEAAMPELDANGNVIDTDGGAGCESTNSLRRLIGRDNCA